ncbi:MAG: hypothetical protein JNK04_12865, partial [Myxococcales bacterium]|nr:hypothetical protein [Myxococcales bacterium]
FEEAFRNAVVKHGSATDDNLAAASAVFLRADRHEMSLRVGRTGPPLGRLLLDAHDVIGSADFFNEKLRQVAELADLSPEAWENAYRVLMLAVDALMACPRHPTPDSER